METKKEKLLTLPEAAGIIVGHGVGSGVLAVPYLASKNSWGEFLILLLVIYGINLLLHLMIAELSFNNDGAQFVKCFELELFKGKLKKFATWTAFVFLGFSVLVNVSGFIAGASAVFSSWFGLPARLGMILYFIAAAAVVLFGLKIVGIAEKISVGAMVGVVGILLAATLMNETGALPTGWKSVGNSLALWSTISFSLSAVMSVPQVVKGTGGDKKRIRTAIAAGTGVNAFIIFLITLMTLLGAGEKISENGALVDLSAHLGGWVSIIGYIFTLLALSTSFWANTLNMRDIIHEQVNWSERMSWLAATLPCLFIALLGIQSFVGFTRLAGVVQVLTGLGIILAYNRSRARHPECTICGKMGALPFQIIVALSSVLATVGSVMSVR